jgi:glycosyltransferase involved in cell wall biosynthesis
MTTKCLFVTHRWADVSQTSGESITVPLLLNTFKEWGLGEFETVWTDECFHAGIDAAEAVQKKVEIYQPDLIVYTPIPAKGLLAQNVSPQAILGIGGKSVSVFFDLAHRAARNLCVPYADASDLSISIDGYDTPIGNKSLTLWAPYQKRSTIPKTIDVSFVGSRRNYPDRRAALAILENAGMPVYVSGGKAEARCSFEEYFDILDKSLITLNFSRTGRGRFNPFPGAQQIKGRVFEALSSGCCLIEDRNKVTARYLTEGVDYIAFDRPKDLPDIINELLKDRDKALLIGENGRRVHETRYSATHFWNAIMDGLNLTER